MALAGLILFIYVFRFCFTEDFCSFEMFSIMKEETNIGKLIEFKLKNNEDILTGILINYSEEWTVLCNNPVDYVLDGIAIIRNTVIDKYRFVPEEEIKPRILKLKMPKIKIEQIDISNTDKLFQDLFEKNIIFSISNFKKNTFLIGRIESIQNTSLKFKLITSNAKWVGEKDINFSKIQLMEFDTDYINSISMIA